LQGRNENVKEVLEVYEKGYKEKILTSKMTGTKKGDWEKYMIQEAKTDGKKFWNLIKDLLGKAKNKDEEIFIYDKKGEKNKTDVGREYMESWRKEIYQKTPRIDLTFWYGGENCQGKKINDRRRERNKE